MPILQFYIRFGSIQKVYYVLIVPIHCFQVKRPSGKFLRKPLTGFAAPPKRHSIQTVSANSSGVTSVFK